jgi:hypothetical protein
VLPRPPTADTVPHRAGSAAGRLSRRVPCGQTWMRRGLSHTGIYIGRGQFIHAENESTGVRVSDLDSEYYSSRWYGATRFAY